MERDLLNREGHYPLPLKIHQVCQPRLSLDKQDSSKEPLGSPLDTSLLEEADNS